MLAERPEYNDKVKAMQGWGPVALMSHIDAPNLSQFLEYIDQVEVSFFYMNKSPRFSLFSFRNS
jgi:hypothetical protein